MNWISPFFGTSPKEEITFGERLKDEIWNDIADVLGEIVPDITEQSQETIIQAKNIFVCSLDDFIKSTKEEILTDDNKEKLKTLTTSAMNQLKSSIYSSVSQQIMEKKVSVDDNLDDEEEELEELKEGLDSLFDELIVEKIGKIEIDFQMSDEQMKTFKSKVERCVQYNKIVSKKKKRIKIIIVGGTQNGKTSMICLIYGIDKKDLENARQKGFGIESDTTQTKEYEIEKNGIVFVLVDTPGWWDSRGPEQEKANRENFENYLKENKDIDVIIFVSRCDLPIDQNQQDAIRTFSDRYGNEVWKKTLVVLTYANTISAPLEYVEYCWNKYYPDKKINPPPLFTVPEGKTVFV